MKNNSKITTKFVMRIILITIILLLSSLQIMASMIVAVLDKKPLTGFSIQLSGIATRPVQT